MSDVTLFVGKGSRVVMPASFVADHEPPAEERAAPAVATSGQAEKVNASSDGGPAVRSAAPSPTASQLVVADAARGGSSHAMSSRPSEWNEVMPVAVHVPQVDGLFLHVAMAEPASAAALERVASPVPAEEEPEADGMSTPERDDEDGSAASGSSPVLRGGGETVSEDVMDAESPLHCPAPSSGLVRLQWKPPMGMPVFTCLSNHVMSALFAVPALDGVDLATVPLGAWPASHFNTLKAAESARLLDAEARGSDVRIGPSTLPGGGRGVFATRAFKAGERLMPFTGQIVYQSLEAEASSSSLALRSSRYGTGKFSSSARHWAKTAVEVKVCGSAWGHAARTECVLKSKKSKRTKKCGKNCVCIRSVWIVPAPFCVAGVVNDYCSVRGVNGTGQPSQTRRRPNAELVQRCEPAVDRSDLTQAGFIHVLVTEDIEEGEEVLLDYGDVYAYYAE